MNKRIIATLLALFVALSCGAAAFAANDTEADAEVVESTEEPAETEDAGEPEKEDEEDEGDVDGDKADEDAEAEDLTAIDESEDEEKTEEPEDDKEEKTFILTLGENRIVTNGDSGKELDVAPCIIDGKVMIPFRAVFEALGAVISWDAETKTVFAVRTDSVIVLQIGQSVMYVNEGRFELDAPTVISNDRTLISIDSVSKAFGSNVAYNEEENSITITD